MYKARSFNDVSGPSIFTHWLETAPNPGRNLPSGHLRRRQNKYLQLSSTLFGDEGVRDHIREKRDLENQGRLQRQILEYEIEKQKLKLEDDRVFNAMGFGGSRKDIDHSQSVENYGSHNLGGQNHQISHTTPEFIQGFPHHQQSVEQYDSHNLGGKNHQFSHTTPEFQQGIPPQQQYINYDQQLQQYQQQAVNYGHQNLQQNPTYKQPVAQLHSINYLPTEARSQGQLGPSINYGPPIALPRGQQSQVFTYRPPVYQSQSQPLNASNYGPSLVLPQGREHFKSAPPTGYRPKSQALEPKTPQQNSQKPRGISKSAYEPSFHDKSNQGRPNYQQYKGNQPQRRHSTDYAPTENSRKQINPDFQLFVDTPPRRKNLALIIK